ncbi:MAG: HD domain-containing protein [Lachnospiraceae bacterium]
MKKRKSEKQKIQTEEEITYEMIRKNPEVCTLMEMGNEVLRVMGYTEHSKKHASIVAQHSAQILETLGYSAHEIELAKIAGFMHDIGNAVNRDDHAHTGAILSYQILQKMGMPITDIALVISAIGNHDEATGEAVTPISAALILADKTDVRRSRVRNPDVTTFDKHDKVNFAVHSAKLTTNTEKKVIHLDIELDEESCSVLDYFEIFLERMLMCRRAAEFLEMRFKFTVNGSKVL